MDEKRVKKTNLIVRIGSAIILAVVLGYILYQMIVVKPEKIGIAYTIFISAGVIGIWLLADIFGPWYSREFEVKTKEEISAYKKYALLGLIGYIGLIYFATSISRDTGFYGALVYVFTLMLKKKQKEIYDGLTDEEDDEEISDLEEVAEDPFAVAEEPALSVSEPEPVRNEAPARPKSVLEAYQSAVRLADEAENMDAITYEVEPAAEKENDPQ